MVGSADTGIIEGAQVLGPARDPAAEGPDQAREPAARLMGIWKSFGAVAVLKGVDLTVRPRRVHALLGGNGAGKSTLVKIMAGLLPCDRGTVEIGGRPLQQASPAAAHSCGLYLVPQEAHILPNQTVLENVCLGLRERLSVLRPQVEALVSELGVTLDLGALGGGLEIADRQIVEILRGLVRRARVLVLDEPTSALTPREVAALFERIRALQQQGVGLVFISHKLGEIREIGDTVSVLRDGAVALESALPDVSDAAIIKAMSRASAAGQAPRAAPRRAAPEGYRSDASIVLKVDGLTGEGFEEMSLSLREGEILGLAGVVGAGRTELAETLFGLRPVTAGTVSLRGEPLAARSPRTCVDAGLVYLPEDRQSHGLFLDAPIGWNLVSYLVHRLPLFPGGRRDRALFARFRDGLAIRCTGPEQSARWLSGGNQQKVLLAKCLAAEPAVLVLDEPTRGVDVTARADLYALIEALARDGVAVMVISSDFAEIARLADRVIVMAHGQ